MTFQVVETMVQGGESSGSQSGDEQPADSEGPRAPDEELAPPPSGSLAPEAPETSEARETRQAREALAISEARYRMLAENSSDVVLFTGPDYRLSWVSPSVTATLGWRPEQLVGGSFRDLVHPEDLARGIKNQAERLAKGLDGGNLEARIATADGGWRWMTDRGHAVRDDEGNVVGGIDALRDIHAEVLARQEAHRSHERFRMLAENASDVVLELAPDNTCRWVSPSVRRSLGWDPEELVGRSGGVLIHPEDLGRVLASLEKARDGSFSVEVLRIARSDGSYTWMSGVSRELRDEDGAPTGRVVGLHDVDELVRAREVAQAEQARLNATLDSLLDPHVLLQAVRDDSGQIVDLICADVNGAACAATKMPRDRLVGARVLQMWPGEGSGELLALCRGVIESGEPLSFDDFALPGQALEVDYRFDIRAIRVGDAMVLTWRDVTERHTSAQALARSEAQLRLLVENATDIVILTTQDGRFEWVSDSVTRALGWLPEELMGRPILDFIHPDGVQAQLAIQADLQQGLPGSLENRFRTKSGDYRWGAASIRPIFNDAGEFAGRVSGWRDTTEEHETREALAASEARYRLLASNVYDVVMRCRGETIIWVSPSLTVELGWQPAQWIGHEISEFLSPEDHLRMSATRDRVLAEGSAVSRLRLRDSAGAFHWVEIHARVLRDEDGNVDGMVSTFRTIDHEVAAEQELERRARFDDLTGTLKRGEALSALSNIAVHRRRDRGDHTAIVFCDVDRFKGINDANGHAGGDIWLATTGRRLMDTVRAGDIVARMGGDEFVVVLDGVHSLDEAVVVAEKLRSAVAEPMILGTETFSATMSLGVTLAAADEAVEEMLVRADRAMYEAKREGGDRVVSVAAPGGP